ncbi:DUF3619 domain-containing protein [Paucibacter aquatile]|uniref:DUF3619 domain-containing protein n=1 Tax=Kinneretia aquatilis TaxID=2070761 RepID=A0A2N8KRC5_9BURK|nr:MULTISPECIES: DUF3619 family protein [Roseateles]PND35980.1 DUF3619 domain-containing protein [Paucibacter aquatile]
MNTSKHSQFAQELDARVARFGLRVAAGLSERNQALPADVSERLRFAREQALLKARSARAAQSELAPSTQLVRNGASLALFGGKGSPRWLKFASLMPLFMLVLGLALIQHGQFYEQILAAAEVDTALLADNLPPSAYSDPGFSEFLSDEQD